MFNRIFKKWVQEVWRKENNTLTNMVLMVLKINNNIQNIMFSKLIMVNYIIPYINIPVLNAIYIWLHVQADIQSEPVIDYQKLVNIIEII